MRKIVLLTTLFVCQFVSALDFKVFGPCQDEPLLHEKVEYVLPVSVGQLTVDIFDKNEVPYIGATAYMQSIFNTPFGLDAMEVISDTYMRSHGWVFSVNGNVPDVYPHEVIVSNSDSVIWYYGYVVYDTGVWATEYLYTNTLKPEQFCQ
ncbi:DUF4430 domain-containing protein [Bacteriovorax sp. Seq25_V]|uniref:DUF4430 domain-containing protein n=1 Tax=Bacteriovorax sp. Seq25_V TaxID=1201288 RepID=UPI000389F24F|nr:DUF4430 domain-containing protein [Bacteriovorax sp. Seq25_V]EQC46551.1 hypothetical protein M900_2338 [Bacteriovorax sp. Seq25_V]